MPDLKKQDEKILNEIHHFQPQQKLHHVEQKDQHLPLSSLELIKIWDEDKQHQHEEEEHRTYK